MFSPERNHATVYGGTGNTKYIQDGRRYSQAFKYLGKVGEDDIIAPSSGKIDPSLEARNKELNLDVMDKAKLIALATSHGLQADGRMSERTLRNKISEHNANIPSVDARPSA